MHKYFKISLLTLAIYFFNVQSAAKSSYEIKELSEFGYITDCFEIDNFLSLMKQMPPISPEKKPEEILSWLLTIYPSEIQNFAEYLYINYCKPFVKKLFHENRDKAKSEIEKKINWVLTSDLTEIELNAKLIYLNVILPLIQKLPEKKQAKIRYEANEKLNWLLTIRPEEDCKIILMLINIASEIHNDTVYYLAGHGRTECLKIVLRANEINPLLKQLDPNFESFGKIALCEAVRYGRYDCIIALLKAGASINKCDIVNGNSALHIAAHLNRIEIARLLIENGANKSIKNKAGQNPLDISKSKGHKQMVELLEN